MSCRTLLAVPSLLLVGAALAGCALIDNQSALTIEAVVNAEYETDSTTNPQDVTADECGAPVDCLEAFTTDEASYLRFGSRERAAEYAATLEDGFVVNFIVMDFAGHDAPIESQRRAMEALAWTWQDYEGTFPAR
ncbi:hypothetical protein B7495_06230 [Cryobacterium sp. LW097]|nr:hypothetical protein B7495_06230 [Cryobacterium sp. LW097]